jgi:hypothetical protein
MPELRPEQMAGLAPEHAAEAIGPARETVRQRLGDTLADKATDAFCLSYVAAGARRLGATRLMAPGLESVALPSPEQQQAVIELHAPESEAVSSESIEATLAERTDWAAVTATLESLGKEVAPAEEALSLLARQNAIRGERDRFYNELGGLRDEVERGTAALATGSNEPPRIGIAAAAVQACWLNNTIRADTHASVLGDVAG